MEINTEQIPEIYAERLGRTLFNILERKYKNEEDYIRRCADIDRRDRRRVNQQRRRRDAHLARMLGIGGSRSVEKGADKCLM